jgi:hypothetical protein
MAGPVHKYKVGQTVDLVASTFRSAAEGHYEITGLRPSEDGHGNPLYRIKSKSEAHERVVAENDLIPVGDTGFEA